MSVKVAQCAAGAKNRGKFVSCVAKAANAAEDAGLLTGLQHDSIMSCAAKN